MTRAALALALLAAAVPLHGSPAAAQGAGAAAPADPRAADAGSTASVAPAARPPAQRAADVASPRGGAARVAELERELAREREARAELERQVDALRAELARCEEHRIRREQDWLGYTRLLATLDPASIPVDVRFRSELEEGTGPAPLGAEAAAEAARREERRHEVRRSLSSLLVLEGVHSLGLLELGGVHDGWAGPVVFRQLDHRGRLSGSLFAERLRLEGSRSSRTLTIVLENGYESQGGLRLPFASVRDVAAGPATGVPAAPDSQEAALLALVPTASPPPDLPDTPPLDASGVDAVVNRRRIVLPDVDPKLWYESLGELFETSPYDVALDDGLWNVAVVRHSLNLLLRENSAGGYYRMVSLAGVVEDTLREVHLEELDALGRRVRRLFADFLRCRPAERGVVLELRDGAVVRGGRKAPFLDGELRLYLPRADAVRWREAGIPGLPGLAGEPDVPTPAAAGARPAGAPAVPGDPGEALEPAGAGGGRSAARPEAGGAGAR